MQHIDIHTQQIRLVCFHFGYSAHPFSEYSLIGAKFAGSTTRLLQWQWSNASHYSKNKHICTYNISALLTILSGYNGYFQRTSAHWILISSLVLITRTIFSEIRNLAFYTCILVIGYVIKVNGHHFLRQSLLVSSTSTINQSHYVLLVMLLWLIVSVIYDLPKTIQMTSVFPSTATDSIKEKREIHITSSVV